MSRDFTLDFSTKTVTLSSGFAKQARKQGTPEYYRFLEYLKIYSGYTFKERQIKRNESQNRYKGMDYDFMREYIKRHEAEAYVGLMLDKLETLLKDMEGISKDHCYPRIKHWFILNYPELKEAGKFVEARKVSGEDKVVSIDAVA